MTQYLFVYGTLRRASPHPLAKFLAERACFVSEGSVAGRLYNLGRYPGMTEATGDDERVVGDVYALTDVEVTMRELDRYEGAESPWPSYFERGFAQVALAAGTTMTAMVYLFRGDVAETQRIASGDWLAV